MKRREFVALVGAFAAWPTIANAQQRQTKRSLIGVLNFGLSNSRPVSGPLEQGLQEQGLIEDQKLTIQYRWGANPEELRKAAQELVDLNVEVILTGGSSPAIAAKQVTSKIPIVGAVMADPVGDGLVASLSRPGGNVTGNAFLGPELEPKRFQMIREVVPAATRVAGLQHPLVYGEETMRGMLAQLDRAAKADGVELQIFNTSKPDEFESAFNAMVAMGVGALIILPSPMFYVYNARLVELAAKHGIPTVYPFIEAVDAGGLMSYGPDIPDLLRRAGKYVAQILKGTRPSDLPVEQPVKFDLGINLKTAKNLGLTVPQSLLVLADKVIEYSGDFRNKDAITVESVGEFTLKGIRRPLAAHNVLAAVSASA